MKIRNLLAVLTACLLLAGSTASFAQSGRPNGPQGGGMDRGGPQGGNMDRGGPPALPDSAQIVKIVDEMAVALSLTADQKAKVSELHFAQFAKVREQMGNASSGDRESHRKQMETQRQEFDSAVKALLTDDQKAAFDKFTKNRRSQSGQQGQRRK